VPPDLPPNFKLGQSRRTAGIVTQSEWNELSRDEGDAVDALSWQMVWAGSRARPRRVRPALTLRLELALA